MHSSESGFSILSALAFSLLSVLFVLGVSIPLKRRAENVARDNQKFQALELEQDLLRIFADPVLCSCNINPLKTGKHLWFSPKEATESQIFRRAGPSIEINKVISGCGNSHRLDSKEVLVEAKRFASNDGSHGLFVSQIRLENIRPRSAGQRHSFVADLKVYFSKESQGPQSIPLAKGTPTPQTQVYIVADTSGNIVDCSGAAPFSQIGRKGNTH